MNLETIKLYFCCITQNRINELQYTINDVYDYVDKLIVIDGGSIDNTVEWLKNKDKDNKIHILISPWSGDFPAQRQKYLDVVRDLREDNELSWIFVEDSDERPSKDLIEKMRIMCLYGEQNNIGRFLIRCKSIELDANFNIIHEQFDDYWKPLLYKWLPELKITGFKVHEGFNINPKTSYFSKNKTQEDLKLEYKYFYTHAKPPGEVWRRAHVRNFTQGGGGDNMGEFNPLWLPFTELLKNIIPEFNTWWDYDNYITNSKGIINTDLKNWYIAHMYEGEKYKPDIWKNFVINNNIINSYGLNNDFMSDLEKKVGYGYSGQSEIKEGYKYFYRFKYPEYEPEELKELSIP